MPLLLAAPRSCLVSQLRPAMPPCRRNSPSGRRGRADAAPARRGADRPLVSCLEGEDLPWHKLQGGLVSRVLQEAR
jgi:hypothetical protein